MGSEPTMKLSFSETVPAGFIRRKDFGSDFLFGSSTSAFQIEGGLEKGGRRPSIFDGFARDRGLFDPHGPDAVNHLELYKEDVKLMKEIGLNSYKFSIAWSRILPTGKIESRNQEGIDFYKDLIKHLKAEEIEPVATLLHFDPPRDLEDQYYTFLDSQIVKDYKDYTDICFQEFGNDVKYWVTITAPWYVAYGGYITGDIPPAYKTSKDHDAEQKQEAANSDQKQSPNYDPNFSSLCPPIGLSIQAARRRSFPNRNPLQALGNKIEEIVTPALDAVSARVQETTTPVTYALKGGQQPQACPNEDEKKLPEEEKWPYIVSHNMILAHAEAVKLYREKYQNVQGGEIGLNFVIQWYEPLEETREGEDPDEAKKRDQKNKDACQRAMDFMFGWFMEPLYRGDYPESMRKYVTEGHLLQFTDEEKRKIKGAYDFISVNYYTSMYVTHEDTKGGDYVLDRRCRFHTDKPLGKVQGAAKWINGYPKGMLEFLGYIKDKYNNPDIYIHENGFDDDDDGSMTEWDSFHDQKRILYLHDHLAYIKQAIRLGVKVKGHFVWSLMDNLELSNGYKDRFGITYVDYHTSQRIPKYSASWYKYFLSH